MSGGKKSPTRAIPPKKKPPKPPSPPSGISFKRATTETHNTPTRKVGKTDKADGANPGGSNVTPGVVVGVGLSTVDMLCVAPRIGERMVELSVFSMQGGGTTGNTIAAVAALGARARYFGPLGDDDFGRYILRGLEEFDVDLSLVPIESGAMSPLSIIQIDELSRRRKVMTTKGSTRLLSAKDVPRDLLKDAGMLCIDGDQPALQAAIAEKARARGVPVLLNANHLTKGIDELLARCDYVIGSERFAAEIAPSDKVERSLQQLIRMGPRCAVVTLGDAGSIGLEGDTVVQKAAIDVFVADTTGAGDVFAGAFAFATLQGWRLDRALPFANAAAGLCCRTIGARAGIPTLQEVNEAIDGE